MLSQKWKIGIGVVVSGLLLAGGICVYKLVHKDGVLVAVDVPDGGCSTSSKALTEEAMVGEQMIGTWQHVDESGWWRVYTSEPAGDGYCWGREWDTSEDINEEDLKPYGNGWFKWKVEKDVVKEWQMTDINGVVIPYEYKLLQLDSACMRWQEIVSLKKESFRKIPGL